MAGNLDDFLRRAQERRRQRQQQQEQPKQRGGSRRKPPPPPPPPTPREPPPRTLVEPEIIIADVAPEPPRQSIDTSDFAERASHMAEEVALADDDMEAHIHQAFDHDLGQLTETADQKKLRQDAAASDLMKMLVSPDGIRQAFVMSEIMRRPDFFE